MRKAFAVATVLAALIAPALAQTAAPDAPATTGGSTTHKPMMGRGMMMGGGMMMGHGMPMHCPMMGGTMMGGPPRTEGVLAFLKAELKISQSQDSAWTAYSDVVRNIAAQHKSQREGGPDQSRSDMMREPLAAPEAIEKRVTFLERHLADMKAIQAATADLYRNLDDDQKTLADDLLGRPCGMAPMFDEPI